MATKIDLYASGTKTYLLPDINEAARSLIDKDKEHLVIFSIYKMEEDVVQDEYLVTGPDILSTKPVIEGQCGFFIDYWRVAPKPVYSKEYTNPTWKDIINACNDLLQNGDGCGVYLENVSFDKTKNGIKYFSFGIGS
jgi:hypothetical protein